MGVNIAKSIEFDKTINLVLDLKAGIGLFHPTLNRLDIPQGYLEGRCNRFGGKGDWEQWVVRPIWAVLKVSVLARDIPKVISSRQVARS